MRVGTAPAKRAKMDLHLKCIRRIQRTEQSAGAKAATIPSRSPSPSTSMSSPFLLKLPILLINLPTMVLPSIRHLVQSHDKFVQPPLDRLALRRSDVRVAPRVATVYA